MLVLTRKQGERIVIDERIVITIVRTDCGKVRVGIDAPAEMEIRREELPARVHVAPTPEPRDQVMRPAC